MTDLKNVIFSLTSILLICANPSFFPEALADNAEQAFSDMSLAQLMNLELFNSATHLPTKQSQAPGTVYSFDQNDFARMGVRRVDEIFQFVPGMQLNQYRKRHQSIWSRGLLDRYNDKLVLLVDGIPMRHLYYGHFSLGDNFPLEKIEKIEIIQGPASSLYGANAFGGIISITTRGFSEKNNIGLSAEAGNHKRKKATVLANSSQLQFFASHLDQDAPFDEDRKSFIGGQVLQPLDEKYSNLFVKSSPVEGLTLSVDYFHNDEPFLFIPDTQDAFIEERLLTLGAHYEVGDLERGKVEVTLFHTQDNAREFEIEQLTQTLGYEEKQNAVTAGASIIGFNRLFENHVFALGATWQHERAEDMNYVRTFRFDTGFTAPVTGSLLSDPDINNDDYAVFIQDVWQLNSKLDITLGGRYDDFKQFQGHFNYRAALVYTKDAEQTWKLLYGTAIRTPSFREYLKVLEGTTFVAPVPEPERIKSLELAYLHQWQHASANITLFHNSVEDFIHEVPTPDGADEYFANSDTKQHMTGIDVLVNYSMDDELIMRLSTSYHDVDSIVPGETPYLASWTAGFNLSYLYSSQHDLGFSAVYNSNRLDTNSYTDDDPDSFVIINVFGSGKISKYLTYGYGIDNIFDIKVYDPAADYGTQHNTEKSEREYWLRLQWGIDL